jgi:hypothetical protein
LSQPRGIIRNGNRARRPDMGRNETPALVPHSVVELERNVRDCRAFLESQPPGISYCFPAHEMLEILVEALAFAKIREGPS